MQSPDSDVRGRIAVALEDASLAGASLSQLCAVVLEHEMLLGGVGGGVWDIALTELQNIIISLLSSKAASIPGMEQMGSVISALIRAEDSYGSPLLHSLVSMGLYPLVNELVTTFHSCLTTECLNALDAQGRTVFAMAVVDGGNGSSMACGTAWLLLQAGADPNIRYPVPDSIAVHGGLAPTALDTHKVLLQAWCAEQGGGSLRGMSDGSVDHLGGAGIHGAGYFNLFERTLSGSNPLPWYCAGGNLYLKEGWRRMIDVQGDEQDDISPQQGGGLRQELPAPVLSAKQGERKPERSVHAAARDSNSSRMHRPSLSSHAVQRSRG